MALGEYIRKLREQNSDLSLREFAKKIQCSPAFVSDIELGRRYPSGEVLSKIAKALGTTIEDLQAHDIRPPTEGIRRLTEEDPRYALAFRQVVDKKVRPEDLMKLAKKESDRKYKK